MTKPNNTTAYLSQALALLNTPSVGPQRFRRLVNALGSVEAVLAAPISDLENVPSIGRKVASDIRSQANAELVSHQMSQIGELGWAVYVYGSKGYPERLAQTDDAPIVLYGQGDTSVLDARMIGVVGTRHPSERGRLFTARLAGELARAGLVVISGMAEGIDSAAHAGCLDAGGKTVAVWGSSLDICYPPSNRVLAQRIQSEGLLLSEYPPETRADRGTFPRRNRIISGLSEGVVVVEAGRKSGALITAAQALKQGRELFAVPGGPDDRMSEGTNDLLRKGARLVTSAEDIFAELPTLRGQVLARKFEANQDLTESERGLANLLKDGPMQVDQLARGSAISATEVLGLLLALEMKGLVTELPGKRFALSDGTL